MDYSMEDPAKERQLTRNITYFMRRIIPSCTVGGVEIDISSVDGSPQVILRLDFPNLPSLKHAFRPSFISKRRASVHGETCKCQDCYLQIFGE